MRLSARTLRMARPSAAVLTRKPSLAKRARNQIANFAMIVDDQDMRLTLHVPNINEGDAAIPKNMCQIMATVAA